MTLPVGCRDARGSDSFDNLLAVDQRPSTTLFRFALTFGRRTMSRIDDASGRDTRHGAGGERATSAGDRSLGPTCFGRLTVQTNHFLIASIRRHTYTAHIWQRRNDGKECQRDCREDVYTRMRERPIFSKWFYTQGRFGVAQKESALSAKKEKKKKNNRLVAAF